MHLIVVYAYSLVIVLCVLSYALQVVVTQYAERFIEQVGAQVQQDSWQPVVLADLAVRSPAKDSSGLDYLGQWCG